MEKYTFKKIGISSFAKFYMYILGAIYGIVSVITGLASLLSGAYVEGLLLIILGPVVAGFFGYILGIIASWFMNLVLKYSGGIDLYFDK